MESVELYSREKLILENGYKGEDVLKYTTNIGKRKIPVLKQKIYFLDNKFPKRLFNKSKFIHCNDINDAEMIAIPKTTFYSLAWYPAKKSNNSKWYYLTWNNRDCTIAKYPIYDHKYLKILDDSRVISYDTLYQECRKSLQTLTEDELSSIEELMNSLDKDVQLMGAMMIAKSNLILSNKLCDKAITIIRKADVNLTKELKAFINEY